MGHKNTSKKSKLNWTEFKSMFYVLFNVIVSTFNFEECYMHEDLQKHGLILKCRVYLFLPVNIDITFNFQKRSTLLFYWRWRNSFRIVSRIQITIRITSNGSTNQKRDFWCRITHHWHISGISRSGSGSRPSLNRFLGELEINDCGSYSFHQGNWTENCNLELNYTELYYIELKSWVDHLLILILLGLLD